MTTRDSQGLRENRVKKGSKRRNVKMEIQYPDKSEEEREGD